MKAPIRIVIDLEGGLIQAIYTDASQASIPLEILVIDWDTEGAEDDSLFTLKSGDECVMFKPCVDCVPGVVEEAFDVFNASLEPD